MPKKLLFTAIALAFFSSPGFAADMAVKAPPLPAPLPAWAGFYVGGNAGGDWSISRTTLDVMSPGSFFSAACFAPINGCQVNVVDVQRAGAQKLSDSGFTGGGQVGYNWQTGIAVYGIESDFNYFRNAPSGVSTVALFSGVPASVTVGQSVSTDWLFTFRGRAGFLVTPSWLVYGTGGLAVTNLHAAWTFSENRFGNAAAGSLSETKVGWTVGTGVETMLTGGWRLGVEYLHVGFDTASSTASVQLPLGAGAPPFRPLNMRQSADLSSDIVRVKVNYAFGGPVVAKY